MQELCDMNTEQESLQRVRKRRRPALACRQCRLKKIKCDRRTPCENCEKSKNKRCTYEADEKNVVLPHHTRGSGVSVFNSNPKPERISKSQSPSPTCTWRTMTTTYAPQQPSLQALSDKVSYLEDRLSKVENRPTAPSKNSKSSAVSADQKDLSKPVRGIFLKSRFFGQSHWMNYVCKFTKIFNLAVAFQNNQESPIGAMLTKCKKLGQSIKSKDAVQHPIKADLRDQLPSRKTVDELVEAYLRTFEPMFRILHIPTFWEEYNLYWSAPRSANYTFIIKLGLVIAIGKTFCPDISKTETHSISLQSIYAAQAWLLPPSEKARMNLDGIRIHCLLLLARLTTSVNGDLIWLSAGALLRSAMHIGLHIDPSHHQLPLLSTLDVESRRRLWATVLELVIQSSLDAGGPPLITTADYDCLPPSNVDDADLSSSSIAPVSAIAKPPHQLTDSSPKVALAHTLPHRLEMANFINHFRPDPSHTPIIGMHERYIAALNSTPLGALPPFQRSLYHLLTQRFVLALNLPFAFYPECWPLSQTACLDAAALIISTLNADPDFSNLLLYGVGIFRDVSGQAATYFCEEMHHENKLRPYAELYGGVESVHALFSARAEAHETNIKGLLFFSCELAHARALAEGRDVESAMLAAMEESLGWSCGVLERRAAEGQGQGQGEEEWRNLEEMVWDWDGADDGWLFDGWGAL